MYTLEMATGEGGCKEWRRYVSVPKEWMKVRVEFMEVKRNFSSSLGQTPKWRKYNKRKWGMYTEEGFFFLSSVDYFFNNFFIFFNQIKMQIYWLYSFRKKEQDLLNCYLGKNYLEKVEKRGGEKERDLYKVWYWEVCDFIKDTTNATFSQKSVP